MSPNNLLIASLYYIFTVLITFFSIFSIYLLIRYGRSIIFAITGSLIYTILFLKILSDSYQLLHILLS